MTEKEQIYSGTYIIKKTMPLVLESFLSTCVGVTLYDFKAKLGGMIHLLLPEPITRDAVTNPEKYASTGLPVFLKKLYKQGARPENLTACIAGGALVGQITQIDIGLDIGGRTTEKVKQILGEEGIIIEKSETGGFYPCKLDLNLETGRTKIYPGYMEEPQLESEFTQPSSDEIIRIMKRLKPIPQITLKLLRMVNEDTYDIQAISKEVKTDQVLTAKTLQLCNSALFKGRSEIDSLDDAILILGQNLFVKSILSATVNTFYDQSGSGYSLCKGGLFYHALITAIMAEKLAEWTGEVPPSVAYTAGLLHDIGMVVLDQYMAQSLPLFYRGIFEAKEDFMEIEKKILGMDHTEAGKRLSKLWQLPETLKDVIKFHHSPGQAQTAQKLTHIIYLSELLMTRFQTGLAIEHINTHNIKQRLAEIGLTPDDLPQMIDLIPLEILKGLPEEAIECGHNH